VGLVLLLRAVDADMGLLLLVLWEFLELWVRLLRATGAEGGRDGLLVLWVLPYRERGAVSGEEVAEREWLLLLRSLLWVRGD